MRLSGIHMPDAERSIDINWSWSLVDESISIATAMARPFGKTATSGIP